MLVCLLYFLSFSFSTTGYPNSTPGARTNVRRHSPRENRRPSPQPPNEGEQRNHSYISFYYFLGFKICASSSSWSSFFLKKKKITTPFLLEEELETNVLAPAHQVQAVKVLIGVIKYFFALAFSPFLIFICHLSSCSCFFDS
jgi:hypothetical protein